MINIQPLLEEKVVLSPEGPACAMYTNYKDKFHDEVDLRNPFTGSLFIKNNQIMI